MPPIKRQDICALCLADRIYKWADDPDHNPRVIDAMVRSYRISVYCNKHLTSNSKPKLRKGKK